MKVKIKDVELNTIVYYDNIKFEYVYKDSMHYKLCHKSENGSYNTWLSEDDEVYLANGIENETKDQVNPSHYKQGNIEVIDFIEDQKLGFNLGNVIKYVCRAGKKNPEKILEDLRKAVYYINREIQNIEKDKNDTNS